MSVAWDTVGKYSTNLFTEEAVRLINAHNADEPMFLYLSQIAPHSGNTNNLLQAPPEEIQKFSYIQDLNRRTYAGTMSLFITNEFYLESKSKCPHLYRAIQLNYAYLCVCVCVKDTKFNFSYTLWDLIFLI